MVAVSTTTTTPPTSHRNTRKQWMEQSLLRRMVTPVKNTVSDIVSISPFLRRGPQNECAVFARHELEINPTPLGTGGFSTVHEITAIHLDESIHQRCTTAQQNLRRSTQASLRDETNHLPRYVLKHLQKSLLGESPKAFQNALRDLAMEIEYMDRLSHRHILPLIGRPVDGLDAISTGYDGFFLITERLDTTLSIKIKEWNVSENPPSIEQRATYIEQLADALAYLHQHRIIFRDLKPDNVGIASSTDDNFDSIKIFDFGLCRELPNNTNKSDNSVEDRNDVYEMSGVGTQRYMASEVLEDLPYNCKVDVYSWGLLSWEIMTGIRPYLRYGNETHKTAVLLHSERPRILPHWPAWLQMVLNKSWCRDISERWTMEGILQIIHSRHHITKAQRSSVKQALYSLTNNDTDNQNASSRAYQQRRQIRHTPRSNDQRADSTWRASSLYDYWNMFPAQAA